MSVLTPDQLAAVKSPLCLNSGAISWVQGSLIPLQTWLQNNNHEVIDLEGDADGGVYTCRSNRAAVIQGGRVVCIPKSYTFNGVEHTVDPASYPSMYDSIVHLCGPADNYFQEYSISDYAAGNRLTRAGVQSVLGRNPDFCAAIGEVPECHPREILPDNITYTLDDVYSNFAGGWNTISTTPRINLPNPFNYTT